MAKVLITESILQDIADAIRGKSGSQDTMTPSEFADNIDDLQIINLSDYLTLTISNGNTYSSGVSRMVKTIPASTTVVGTNLSYGFNQSGITTLPLIDTSNVTNMKNFCSSCPNLTSVALIDTSNVTNMENMFNSCTSLVTIPLLNTGNATNMSQMLTECSLLQSVPALNMEKATNITAMFTNDTALTTLPQFNWRSVTSMNNLLGGCRSLTNDSLNNLLGSLASATSYTGTKTLYYVFGNRDESSYYPASTIQGLSNYQDFIDAGWTIGWS